MAPTTNRRPSRSASRSEDAVNVPDDTATPKVALTHISKTATGIDRDKPLQTQQSTECPDCGTKDRVTEGGTEYCTDCGIVLSDSPLEHSEPPWRKAEDRRLGPAQSNQWLNTGTSIDQSVAGDAKRLSKYNKRLTSGERSIVYGLREIRSLSAGIELPEQMRERAAYLYQGGAHDGLLVGRSIDGLAAACVFLAARERHYPMTIDHLAEYSPVSTSKVRQHVQVVRSKLNVNIPPAHPRDFLPLIASRLDLRPGVERQAAEYLERATANAVHVGKHPAAIAATVVYRAANDQGRNLTQQAVADAGDVSTVTISRHHQEVREALSELVTETE